MPDHFSPHPPGRDCSGAMPARLLRGSAARWFRLDSMNTHEWLLKRNCSLSPRQLGTAYAVLLLAALAVAAMFVLQGAWHVLVFALLEMAAVALAFLHYARHATDHEHIALAKDCLLVERVEGGAVRQVCLDPRWTHIALPQHAGELVGLEARGVTVEVGTFVTDAGRRKFAQELQQELQRQSAPAGA